MLLDSNPETIVSKSEMVLWVLSNLAIVKSPSRSMHQT